MLATSLPVAQWLEHPTGVRKVMGSIPVGDLHFFLVPRSRHVEYSIFSYFFPKLKKNSPAFFIKTNIITKTKTRQKWKTDPQGREIESWKSTKIISKNLLFCLLGGVFVIAMFHMHSMKFCLFIIHK